MVVLVAEAGATSVRVLAAVSEAEAVRLGGVIVGYGLAEWVWLLVAVKRRLEVPVAVVETGATTVLVLASVWVGLLVAVRGGLLPLWDEVREEESDRVAVMCGLATDDVVVGVRVLEAVRLGTSGGVIVGYHECVYVLVGVGIRVEVPVIGAVRVALVDGVTDGVAEWVWGWVGGVM